MKTAAATQQQKEQQQQELALGKCEHKTARTIENKVEKFHV